MLYEITVKLSNLQMMPTAGGHLFSVYENKFAMSIKRSSVLTQSARDSIITILFKTNIT